MNFGKNGVARKEKQLTSKSNFIRKSYMVSGLKLILVICLFLFVVGACAGFGLLKGIIDSAPSIDTIDATPTGYRSVVLDDEGNEIATLVSSGANRVYVTIDEIPTWTQLAFVAIEDERFYEHNGIDIQGIIRAAVKGITNGFNFTEGASTITQQLLKNNVFTTWTSESNFIEKLERKIQEQYLAVQLSKTKSKDWVLENYLNTINLGQSCLGIQAAAQRYFGKDVSELTISESAVIASITQNPTKWNPITNPEANAERRETVLYKMKELGFITEEEYEEAMADDVYSRILEYNTNYDSSSTYSYFVDELIEQVIEDLVNIKGYTETQAYKALYQGGLTIYSTQNSEIQAICDEEMNNSDNYPSSVKYSFSYRLTVKKADGTIVNYSETTLLNYYKQRDTDYTLNYSSIEKAEAAIEAYKAAIIDEEAGDVIVDGGESVTYTLQPQASVVIMDQATGEVKALVGGRGDKTASRTLNRATDSLRQPGSTFKILACYAPALDTAGLTLATVQDDAPYTYASGAELNNSTGTFKGLTTIRDGIINSVNVVAVKTLTDISPQLGYDYLLNFGFTTLSTSDIGQALTLGGITNGVSTLELTAAYATIANGGVYTKPRFYTKILDSDGNVLIDNTAQTKTVLKETTAFLLTDAMRDVMTEGTGKVANFSGMDIAGKSGTTNDSRDLLFAGYTPYYTCVIWGGYDDNSSQSGIGTSYVKKLWNSIMSQVHSGLAYKSFSVPDGITTATICTKSGKLAIEGLCDCDPSGTSKISTEYFTVGTVPTEYCDQHISATICSTTGLLATENCPDSCKVTKVFLLTATEGTTDESYGLPTETCTVHTTSLEELE